MTRFTWPGFLDRHDVKPQVIATAASAELHSLVLRSDAEHRVSKDDPARGLVGDPWSVLRDAALCAAPQDEAGVAFTDQGTSVT